LVIAIGTIRKPKIDAVKAAFEKIQKYSAIKPESVEFLGVEVESDIAKMPLSISELMQGAYNRVQNLVDDFKHSECSVDYYVGLEGGFFRQQDPANKTQYFLQGWVYVSNGDNGYFGATTAISVPEKIVDEVIRRKKELGEIIDQFGNDSNIRDKGGAFAVFTQGILTRRASFEFAVVSAFVPFFNQSLYGT
jgi:inosine/xanthosine triphosphatase